MASRRGLEGMRERRDDMTANGDHTGVWVLLEARLQLLSIGTAQYPGHSPRNHLHNPTRSLLVPRARQAVNTGIARTDTATFHGQRYRTRVVPIAGPVSGNVLAVLCACVAAGESLPEDPTVGAWEWHITPPGPEQQMRTYWSRSLFEVYGMNPPAEPEPETAPQWNWWHGPEWLDRLIVESDRVPMRRVVDAFLHAESDQLFTHSYRVYAADTGKPRTLRLAGRSYHTADGQWFRGISMPLADQAASVDRPPKPDILSATLALSRDPLVLIDPTYEHLYLTSPAVSGLGIDLPGDRYLPGMCHPDDLLTLRGSLAMAVRRAGTAAPAKTVRLRGVDGGWREVECTCIAVTLAEAEPHHVLARLVPTAEQER